MLSPSDTELEKLCSQCIDKERLGFDFTMAFQPIVDWQKQDIFGYEALCRGPNNESAYSIISQVNDRNRYQFDQQCRIKAIALASQLNLKTKLSINFLPNAIYKPERCIRTTLEAAKQYQFPTENIMFEFTEGEKIEDTSHVRDIVGYYRSMGFQTAIDDFGAGHSGLNLLSSFQTDIIKLDMELIRGIATNKTKQIIIQHCVAMFKDLHITPLAEGIETLDELHWLADAGISLMQGYVLAKPGFERLPQVDFASLNN